MKKVYWRNYFFLTAFIISAFLLVGCADTALPTPTATDRPTATLAPSATPEPTETPTPTLTPEPTPTDTPQPTPTTAVNTNVDSACPVTLDDSYGYTEENAISVGGGAFDGPSRERAYLDTLRGPNGGTLSYNRAGSLPFEDTILDIYIVSSAGLAGEVTLYIDEYSFAELFAPVGFTCDFSFPLTAP